MGHRLSEIAQKLKDSDKKVQLIYAFNGTGKTRLSKEFKELVAPNTIGEEEVEATRTKILYYNAFTEDLFYWNNDLNFYEDPKLLIQENSFTNWIFDEQGQDQNIIANFQHYTDDKLTPHFNEDFSEVTFSFERGDEESSDNIKISKGEESNFIWSIFYSLIEQVIEVLNTPEPIDRETDQFNNLEYIFIDDPVSSLDENHLIELAVDLAELIKRSESELKFIITTHNPLFYNVLHNELNYYNKDKSYRPKHSKKYLLEKEDDGLYKLIEQTNDSPFSYHLFLRRELSKAIERGEIYKYHYNFLRNILEKTATFLGYSNWGDLLNAVDGNREAYESRIINLSSHSKHSSEEVAKLTENDKRVLKYLISQITEKYRFNQT